MAATRAAAGSCRPGQLIWQLNIVGVRECQALPANRFCRPRCIARSYRQQSRANSRWGLAISEQFASTIRRLPAVPRCASVIPVRYHGGHGHSHGGHGHSHGEEDEDGEDPISVRFAKGESFGSIFMSRMTKASGRRIGAVGVACAASWFDVLSRAGIASLPFEPIGAAATVLGGYPVLKHGWADLRAGRVSLSLSMSIGILAALGTGETFTSALMTLVVLLSEQLEELTVSKAQANITTMLDALPNTVEVVSPTGAVRIEHLSNIRVGDMVRIRPGGHVPVDGVVVSGTGYVNESQMTGESMPEKKEVGSSVYAGSINQLGVLEVTAAAVGDATVYGQILTTVREAEHQRAPVEALADNVAKYVVYFAFTSSAITLYVTGAIPNAVSVLVVAGACGIAAGTPLAIVGGIGKAARRGCVIKGGQHLEMLGNIDTVVFDKTGTLTSGAPTVADVFRTPSTLSDVDFARTLLAVESRSEHPIGHAVVQYAEAALKSAGGFERDERLSVSNFRVIAGRGLGCVLDGEEVLIGNREMMRECGVTEEALRAVPLDWEHSVHAMHASEVLLVVGGQVVGGLLVRDTIRPEAMPVIDELKKLGIRTIMASGDRPSVVEEVSRELGIDEYYPSFSPIAKAELIERLVREGSKVAMVGDGVNDAGAMSKASVGIAMGNSSTLTQHAAKVVLLHDTLERIPESIKISRQARFIIYQNMIGTLAVDVLGSFAAFKGMLPPALAASFHGIWDVLFILNSARLLVPPKSRGNLQHSHEHGKSDQHRH